MLAGIKLALLAAGDRTLTLLLLGVGVFAIVTALFVRNVWIKGAVAAWLIAPGEDREAMQ